MAVVIETTLGDITVDLYTDERPQTCKNFLKLCKIKYYNFCLFHSIQANFIAQTGDPSGAGTGGESVYGLAYGKDSKYYEAEKMPKIKHSKPGLLSMVNCGNNMLGSQFFVTLGADLQSLEEHCVFAEVTEGHDILIKLNDAICDNQHRPYQDIRITHTVILDDPFDDLPGLLVPPSSPDISHLHGFNGRIGADEKINDDEGLTEVQLQEIKADREAKARATILEIVGDLPDAEIAPPENVLFVCKLNPVTTDEDLEIIFSRFGKVKSCEVIRDHTSGDSLQYAFVEFEDQRSCEQAYLKMDNVLIDDRRIHVDFSQSVSKIKWRGKGRGVVYFDKTDEKETSRSSDRYNKRDYYRHQDRDRDHRNDRRRDDDRRRRNDRDVEEYRRRDRRKDDNRRHDEPWREEEERKRRELREERRREEERREEERRYSRREDRRRDDRRRDDKKRNGTDKKTKDTHKNPPKEEKLKENKHNEVPQIKTEHKKETSKSSKDNVPKKEPEIELKEKVKIEPQVNNINHVQNTVEYVENDIPKASQSPVKAEKAVSVERKKKRRRYVSSSSASSSSESSISSSSSTSVERRKKSKKSLMIAKKYYHRGKLVKVVKKKKNDTSDSESFSESSDSDRRRKKSKYKKIVKVIEKRRRSSDDSESDSSSSEDSDGASRRRKKKKKHDKYNRKRRKECSRRNKKKKNDSIGSSNSEVDDKTRKKNKT